MAWQQSVVQSCQVLDPNCHGIQTQKTDEDKYLVSGQYLELCGPVVTSSWDAFFVDILKIAKWFISEDDQRIVGFVCHVTCS